MEQQQTVQQTTPDFLFIDAILLSYRLGRVRYEEQKVALLAAARAAKDAIGFMNALENFGVGRRSQLHRFIGEFLAAPSHFRTQYPSVLGLRRDGEKTESFLGNQRVLFFVEAVLTHKQQKVFYDTYWWFVHNHQTYYFDPQKGQMMGVYATVPQDNASTLARFETYILQLVQSQTKYVRLRYEGFPTDIVLAILKRAFL